MRTTVIHIKDAPQGWRGHVLAELAEHAVE